MTQANVHRNNGQFARLLTKPNRRDVCFGLQCWLFKASSKGSQQRVYDHKHTIMAFRKHDPNVLRPPDVETDKTWIVSKSTTNNRSKRNDTDDLDIGAILNEFNDGGKSTIPVGNKTTCSARPLGINNTSFSVHNDNQFEIIPKPDGPNVPTKQRTLAIELGKEHRRKRNTLAQQFYSQEPKPVVQEPPVLVRKSGNLKLNVIGTKRGATIQSSLQHAVHGSNVVLLGRSSKPSTKSSLQREAKLTSLDYKSAATTLPSPVPKKVPFPFYHDSLPDEPTKFNDDQPSLEDYKREIRSLTDSGKSEAVFKAEIILRSMIVEHKATKTGSQPDAVCFNRYVPYCRAFFPLTPPRPPLPLCAASFTPWPTSVRPRKRESSCISCSNNLPAETRPPFRTYAVSPTSYTPFALPNSLRSASKICFSPCSISASRTRHWKDANPI